MFDLLLVPISDFILSVISFLGYGGVFFLMALESANIPIPSEIIMPFAGFLAGSGAMKFWLVVLSGTLGNVAGSIVSYEFAHHIIKYRNARFVRIILSPRMLTITHAWFEKWGNISVFIGRLLPVVRTFISLPAGLGKMKRIAFIFYTALGSFVWSFLLAYIGLFLGRQWDSVGAYFRQFDFVIIAVLFAVIAWWIISHVRNSHR